MKEKTLLKIAVLSSVLGLLILFFISSYIPIQEINIDRIDEMDIGEPVKIYGEILKVGESDKVLFLQIGQEKIEKVEVILFKDSDFDLKEGNYVEIIGEIDDYQGKREIIAHTVKII